MKPFLLAGALLTLLNPAAAQQRPKPEEIFQHSKLEVVIPDFPANGLILDIGGGGEGVIGQLKGSQVVAIDMIPRELKEAPGNPLLKIIMDARELKFLDQTFPTATVFFTFMYINLDDRPKVVQEIKRVLKPGGRLLIWDAIFPAKKDPLHRYIRFPLHVKLPAAEINTGYGVMFNGGIGLEYYRELAKTAGMEVVSSRPQDGWFFLELKKPNA